MIGTIYAIREISNDKIIYVGSTNKLKPRINNHIYHCYTLKKDYPVYKYIKSIAANKSDFYSYFEFVILYTTNCESSRELNEIEQQFLNKYNDTILNAQKAFRSEEDNNEYRRKYMNQYYKENEDYRQKTIERALDRYYGLKNN